MSNEEKDLVNFSESETLEMFNETSQLLAKYQVDKLSTAAVAAQGSNELANSVEFWKWMGRNYSGSGIFDSTASMQQYISQGSGQEGWMIKQLQGKGYEWDWMKSERSQLKNIFERYDAGDVANRAASDVTKRNILTGKTEEYQMKAYTSKTNPHLKNTPKDTNIVTNAEKVDVVKANGYEKVTEFQDNTTIKKQTQNRMDEIKSGKASTTYNFKNVAGTMAKAGAIGCVIGMGTEALTSYKAWKQGSLSGEDYIKEILKSGGDAGITGAATAGIMVPITAAITAAGASTLVTLPIAFVIGGAVNKIVAPCFGRGQYKEILSDMKYYQNLENIYDDMTNSMEYASEQYYNFVSNISKQNAIHEGFKKKSMEMNKGLKDLYDSI